MLHAEDAWRSGWRGFAHGHFGAYRGALLNWTGRVTGTWTALIAQAVGRKDQADANVVFNQSLLLASVCAAVTLIGGYALTSAYVGAIAADAQTEHQGTTYLYWFLPGLARDLDATAP